MGFSGGSVVKNPPANAGDLGWEDPLEKEMATHSSILGKSHGQRSLAGCSPWDRRVGHDLVITQQQV